MTRKERNKKAAQKAARKRITGKAIRLVWLLFFAGISFITLSMYAVSRGVFGPLPGFEELENPENSLATEIYSADGELIGTFFRENRSNVLYKDLSPNLVNALIATEDRRFENHSGIDLKGLIRVLIKTVFLGNPGSGGGSTLTQQLAKNLFHSPSHSLLERIPQKAKEWIIAAELERRYTKEEIITMYLNTVEFVNNAHGIKSAARVYFSSTPDSLDILQSATLVGMVKNPSLYNPVRFPEKALERRNVVLAQMVKYGYLDQSRADSLMQQPLNLHYSRVDHHRGLAPYLRERLRLFMHKWVKTHPRPDSSYYDIYRDGLKIYTTIDSRMQRYAEEAMRSHLKELQATFFKHWDEVKAEPWTWDPESAKYKPDYMEHELRKTARWSNMKKQGIAEDSIRSSFDVPHEMQVFSWKHADRMADTTMTPYDSVKYYRMHLQPGFMAVDPKSGEIKAYVGGVDHRFWQLDHVTTRRQVGSTFKPFVYTAAIKDLHYSPCQKFANVDYPNPDFDNWAPRNSGKYKDGEMIALWDALAHSVNKITAKLMLDLGSPGNVIDLVRQMGINAPIPEVPSIALGTTDISVEEMTGAYTTYDNRGIYAAPYYIDHIEDKYGNVIARFSPTTREVLNEDVAYTMLYFLEKVVDEGTGRRLRYRYKFEGEIAGKTGTTQDNTDGWFMGVIPDLVTGTWVGGDDPLMRFRSTHLGQGANMALPIFAEFLKRIYADKTLGISPEAEFPKPAEPLSIELDCEKYESGHRSEYDDLEF